MMPKRRVSRFISVAEDSGKTTSKLPLPMLSAALASASMGAPKRRAIPWAVIKPMISTATPTSPSTVAITMARSRA